MQSPGKEWNWLLYFTVLFFALSLHWFVLFGFQSKLFSPFPSAKPPPSIVNVTSLPLTCLPPTLNPHPIPHNSEQFNTFFGKISIVGSTWPHHLSALYSTFLTTDDKISICTPPVFHSSLHLSCHSSVPTNNPFRRRNFTHLSVGGQNSPPLNTALSDTWRSTSFFYYISKNQQSNLWKLSTTASQYSEIKGTLPSSSFWDLALCR